MKAEGAVLERPSEWPSGAPWPPRLSAEELESQHEGALAAVAAALAGPQNCECSSLSPSQLPPAVLPSSNVSA